MARATANMKDRTLEYGSEPQRWRWRHTLLLLAGLSIFAALLYCALASNWGIFDVRISFTRP